MASGTAVSMDFICSPDAVWDVLVCAALYPKWYLPDSRTEVLADADGLALGSKLKFGDSETSVVTAFDPVSRFAVTTGSLQHEITVTPTDFGCRVSLRVSGSSMDEDSLKQHTEETITKLKETVYSNIEATAPDPKPRIIPRRKPRRRIQRILSGLLQGYSSPIEKNTAVLDSVEFSSIIDHSDLDVVIHLRAGLVALMCAVFLFSTLVFSSRFERLDIVPSSGMSLTESIDVTKENAASIYIGQFQNDLELMLNCRGKRLSNTDFYYASTARGPSGEHLVQLIISYDAYGKVRTLRFVDNAMAQTPLDLPLSQLTSKVFTGMSPIQAEHAVGYPLSGFIKEINGKTTVFFGILERYDRMNGPTETSTTFGIGNAAELVITLDPALELADLQYHLPYDTENPLPVNEITEKVRRQYNNYFDSYRADYIAYEKMFLLYSIPRTDASIILGSEPYDYVMAENGLTAYYTIYSRVLDEEVPRYIYGTEFGDNDVIRQVTVMNQYLTLRPQTLFALEDYNLTLGMTLYEACGKLEIVPTYAVLNPATLTLCFGQRVAETNNAKINFELCLIFDAASMTLGEIVFNA